MPRMSKKRKQEWALFLNERNRITYNELCRKYNELKEKCRPFLEALEHFPEVAKLFTEKVKQLFSFKEAQERAEKEAGKEKCHNSHF